MSSALSARRGWLEWKSIDTTSVSNALVLAVGMYCSCATTHNVELAGGGVHMTSSSVQD